MTLSNSSLPFAPVPAIGRTVTVWGPSDAVAALQADLDSLAGPAGAALRLVAGDDLPRLALAMQGESTITVDGQPDAGLAGRLAGTLAPLLADAPEGLGVILYPDLAQGLAPVLSTIGDSADPAAVSATGGFRTVPDQGADRAGGLARSLAHWCALAEALLAVWARHRRRLILIPTADPGGAGPARADARLVAALAGRLGLPVAGPPPAAGPRSEGSATAVAALARFLAAGLLQTRPDLRDLLGRLEAAGLALQPDDGPSGPGPDAELRTAFAGLMRTHAALEARALAQQDRLHALALRRHEMATETALQEARRQVDRLEGQIAHQQADQTGVAALEDQVTALEDQIAALENQVTALEDQIAALENQVTALEDQIIALEAAHAAALRGAEQRAAEQVTALQAALARAEVAAEAELREAIAKVEARLAPQVAEIARLTADLDNETRASAARLADIGQLARDIALRDGRIRMLAEALQRSEDEVTAVRASHSWRITAPLRAVSLAVRRLRS